MASPRPAGASAGTQAASADSTASSPASAQVSNASRFMAPPRSLRSLPPEGARPGLGRPGARPWLASKRSLGPRPQLAVFEHLHLLLDRLEAGTAVLQELGAAAIARKQALERQLPALHRGDQRLQLAQRDLVAGGYRRRRVGTGIGRHSVSRKTMIVVSRPAPDDPPKARSPRGVDDRRAG